MSIRNILSNDSINLDIKSTTKKEVLEELIEMLDRKGIINDKSQFYEDICLRENEGSTAIGNYIAIPHGQSRHVTKFFIAIGKTISEVEWEKEGSFPVKFIILFAVPDVEGVKNEMHMMARICKKLGEDDLCNKLLEVENYEDIVEILS